MLVFDLLFQNSWDHNPKKWFQLSFVESTVTNNQVIAWQPSIYRQQYSQQHHAVIGITVRHVPKSHFP